MSQLKKIPLSVFIIAKNEEDRIANAIEPLTEISDEILLIDSGSTDKTCQIAEKKNAKVIFNKWQGYGPQKIFGEKNCKNKWILNIDADEVLSQKCVQEIYELFQNGKIDNFQAYKIKIVNKFRFEKKPKKLAYYYNQIRLYNKDYGGFKNSSIHDSVQMRSAKQKIGNIKNIIHHQSFRSFSHWLDKINSYSSMQATDFMAKNKKPSNLKIFLSPILAFFKAYFIRRYFIYGLNGVIYSKIFAFSRFAKMIKIREAYEAKNYK